MGGLYFEICKGPRRKCLHLADCSSLKLICARPRSCRWSGILRLVLIWGRETVFMMNWIFCHHSDHRPCRLVFFTEKPYFLHPSLQPHGLHVQFAQVHGFPSAQPQSGNGHCYFYRLSKLLLSMCRLSWSSLLSFSSNQSIEWSGEDGHLMEFTNDWKKFEA